MRHKISGRRFDRATGPRLAMYRGLVTALLGHEKITTTEAKAKEVRGMAEKIITLGKHGGLGPRRQALAFVYDPKVVDKVFSDLAPRYKERPGGYVRLTKLGPRHGDWAEMVQMELVK
jgi:large subunit ribosomal protein L17